MSIHKKRRKVEICHNCHTILSLENNFCPQCGQENHDLKVPIGHLAFEVFEGFTHFDTKFYNTMRSIFLSPGKITKDFLEGRRGRYVPPVRLYFLISFVFFLGLGSAVDLALENGSKFLGDFISSGFITIDTDDKTDKPKKELKKNLEKAKQELVRIQKLGDTTGLFEAREAINQANAGLKLYEKIEKKAIESSIFVNKNSVSVGEILDEMNVQKNDTLRILIETLSEEKQHLRLIDIQKQIIADTINTEEFSEISPEMRTYFTETIGKKRQLQYSLNLYALKNNASIKINYNADTVITIKGSNGSLENTAYLRKVLTMNDSQLDSLNGKNGQVNVITPFLSRGFLKNLTYYQLAFSEDGQKASAELAQLAIGVFSLMMFILMPIVALLLKIIYSKRSHSFISYPFRFIRYIWDWLLYLIRFRKIRKYRHVPHVFFGHTRYYYEHLIFSIHIHAVFFLMLMIFVGGGIILGFGGQAALATVIGFLVYFIVSLKTVYRQGILKTLFKSVILFFMYVTSFFMILTFTGIFKFALS
jgi:Protein of unknown function (DUF3667)